MTDLLVPSWMAEARAPMIPSPGNSVDARAVMMRISVQAAVAFTAEVSGWGTGRGRGFAWMRKLEKIERRESRTSGECILGGVRWTVNWIKLNVCGKDVTARMRDEESKEMR